MLWMRALHAVMALTGVLLMALAGAYTYFNPFGAPPHVLVNVARAHTKLPVVDPLDPTRPLELREAPARGTTLLGAPPGSDSAWVSTRPLAALREERKPSERGGVDTCDTPDPGRGDYLPGRMSSGCLVIMPHEPTAPDGSFDLVLHFHGHELASKEFLRAKSRFVFVGTTSKRYSDRLGGANGLDSLVKLAEDAVSERAGKTAHARHVALFAWSGGYEAILVLLEQSVRLPDAVVLLDGLHGSRTPAYLATQLAPIVGYARRAVNNEVFMYVSHSSIDTDGFASSTEGVHFLVHALGGRPLQVEREDPLGMRLVELFSSGSFHARGYAGGGKSDHCAHLTLYPMVLQLLEKRWH